ncbi:MAG: DUF5335 family protein [Pyrinomonadaceae bacterium]|nr:DUF5335 family protein [Pyrinomonadaceae bacterium]MBP6211546.1 DUF5335 family protein [Pyrinomonadaceae bacterium]
MTQKIQKADWADFFNRISQDFLDWETSVQVLGHDSGAQMLSEGLPFNGMTYDNKHGHNSMELNVGFGTDNHQTHNIDEPQEVAFEPNGRGPGGTLDIEDRSGNKTLVSFLHPMPMLVEYVKSEILTIG